MYWVWFISVKIVNRFAIFLIVSFVIIRNKILSVNRWKCRKVSFFLCNSYWKYVVVSMLLKINWMFFVRIKILLIFRWKWKRCSIRWWISMFSWMNWFLKRWKFLSCILKFIRCIVCCWRNVRCWKMKKLNLMVV